MEFPSSLQYTRDHEWIEIDGSTAKIGVTGFAIEQLGDIVHLDLPAVGTEFEAGDSFGTIESTKTVSDLYLPIAGTIAEVNDGLQDKLESLAEDPYEGGWLVKVTLTGNPSDAELLSPEKYETFVQEEN